MKIQELIEGRNKIAADMRSMHETAETEDKGFTPEQRDSWDSMTSDLASLDSRIETAQRAQEIGGDLEMPTYRLPQQQIKPDAQQIAPDAQPEGPTHRSAWNTWARRGVAGCTDAEQQVLMEHRAQSGGTDTEGGFTVPTDMATSVIEAMKQYGGIANVCTTLNTSAGNPYTFPTNNDTTSIGEIVAENIAATEEDAVFGQKTLGAYKFSSKLIRVSKELLADSGVQMEAYLTNILAKRLGRAEAGYFATGSGTGEPEGLMTGATISTDAAAAAALSYADVLALEHSVDPSYRESGLGQFGFQDATLLILKGLVDGESRPLWLPSLAESAPATILGRRYFIDQGIAAVGASARSMVFGDMSAFTVRRTLGVSMSRLEERYAEYFQVAFLGWTRADSALLDTSAVGVLTHPAS